MIGRGRPLRFLMAVTCAWVGLRVVLLWPHIDSVPALLDAIVPAAHAEGQAPVAVAPRQRPPAPAKIPATVTMPAPHALPPRRVADPEKVRLALLALTRFGDPDDPPASAPGVPRPIPRGAKPPSRWSGSFWLLARGGNGFSSGVIGGQLGGSQAGVRLAYLLDRRRRIALAARVTSPLGLGAREASIGVEWQPTRLPIRLVAEQRIAIDGGRGGPGLAVVGGAGPLPLAAGFRIDGYGQAGVIKRDVAEAYVDGAVHLSHPLGRLAGVTFDLGGSVWGAAQRGAARLDIGPSLGAVVPLGKQRVRLSLDWRERLAGNARPGSGLALTLGADF